jgi:hypothetical protein
VTDGRTFRQPASDRLTRKQKASKRGLRFAVGHCWFDVKRDESSRPALKNGREGWTDMMEIGSSIVEYKGKCGRCKQERKGGKAHHR